jgi:ribosomal peptide maturation radical SAM protein 1
MKDAVALISMPFAPASFPSLGISLLQAGLRREGVSCDLYYLNLRFAANVVSERCYEMAAWPQPTLYGDWIFAGDLFGELAGTEETYRKDILFSRLGGKIELRTLLEVVKARKQATAFLEDCLGAIDFSRYRIVGFSSTFEQSVASLALARRLKVKHPDTVIVLGGANCEAEMGIELHRQFQFIDYVCSGEGDYNFPELVKRVFRGQSSYGLDGIIARRNDETVVPPKSVSPIIDLDWLPIPNYDDYFAQLQSYGLEGRFELVPFESSRGCWWGATKHCTFCALNGTTMTYRSKSPGRVLEELAELSGKYGASFGCVDNILDLKYLDSVFPLIEAKKPNYRFHYETKVNLKKRHLKQLSDAGVKSLQPGIESLSSPILTLMEKGCTLLQNLQFLKWAKQYGIKVGWNLLYGFPGEDPNEYAKMVRLIPSLRHLDPPTFCDRVRVDRFSPYFTRWQEFGFRQMRPDRAYSYVYPFEQEVLQNLAYFFEFDHDLADSVESYAGDMVEATVAWQNSSRGANLIMQQSGCDLLLIDMREPGHTFTTRLQEPLSTVYRLCDEAMSAKRIRSLMSDPDGMSGQELEAALDSLVDRGLMAKDGLAYLSLAVPAEATLLGRREAGSQRDSARLSWQQRSAPASI